MPSQATRSILNEDDFRCELLDSLCSRCALDAAAPAKSEMLGIPKGPVKVNRNGTFKYWD